MKGFGPWLAAGACGATATAAAATFSSRFCFFGDPAAEGDDFACVVITDAAELVAPSARFCFFGEETNGAVEAGGDFDCDVTTGAWAGGGAEDVGVGAGVGVSAIASVSPSVVMAAGRFF